MCGLERILKTLSNIICIAFLCACVATPSREVDPKTLRTPAADKKIALKDTYAWALGRSGAADIKYVLSAGIYSPEFSEDTGTYYRGPEKCVSIVGSGKETTTVFMREGGIFIPTAQSESPKIYLYKSSNLTPSQVTSASGANTVIKPAESILDSNHGQQLQNLVVSPVAGPNEILTKGVGAGIGAAIVTGVIAANEGKIMIPDNQPNNQLLMSLIDF